MHSPSVAIHMPPLKSFKVDEVMIGRVIAFIPLVIGLLAISLFLMDSAFAQMAMPWEGPLCRVAMSLKGPVAKAVAVIAIVVCGLMMAVGETSGVFKTMLGLLAGVSMALLASNWLGFIDAAAGAFSCNIF